MKVRAFASLASLTLAAAFGEAASADELVLPLEAPPAADSPAQAGDPCQPQLFRSTHDIVSRLNRHSNKLLRRIREILEHHPGVADGSSQTFERQGGDGIDHRFTVSRSGDTYTFGLDLAVHDSDKWVTVASGAITRPHDEQGVTRTTGTMTLDFDALRSVDPNEPATGQMEIDFDLVKDPSKPAPGIKKTTIIKLVDFLPEEGDPHGPRNGTYTHVGEPGVGGSFVYTDELILPCLDNTPGRPTATVTVARWFKGADGAVHGRADARASGGEIPSDETWIAVVCHRGVRSPREPDSGYWMMKLEDAIGATILGSERRSSEACDPAFGPVPSLKDSRTDYDFSQPVSFPNEW